MARGIFVRRRWVKLLAAPGVTNNSLSLFGVEGFGP